MPGSGDAIAGFLRGTVWDGAARTTLAGDASRRRYERISGAGDASAILMIAPTDMAGDLRRFSMIARALTTAGFSAPRMLKEAPEAGLLLLEDLGDALFARLCAADPVREAPLYAAAVECLAALHETAPPPGLSPMTPEGLAQATDLAVIWYAGGGTGEMDRTLTEALACRFDTVADLARVTVLRDFHAENLIWLSDREGVARVGLLDFQDALLGHRAYDVVSLLQDARRDVAPDLAGAMLRHYLDRSGCAATPFREAAALFGVQRNLRILGVFARLSLSEGKTGYLRLLPRVWAHLVASLETPGLEAIRERILSTMPPPTPALIVRLTPR